MTRTSTGARNRGGTARQRSVAAAARAAAKRAERARTEAGPAVVAGPPVRDGDDVDEQPETPEAAEPEPAEPAEPGERAEPEHRDAAGAGRPARARLLRALLAVATAAAVAAAVFLGWEYRQAETTRQARSEAAEAARKAAPVILSYDHRHLEKDFAAARSHLTGDFLEKFEKTTTSVVAPTAKKYDGVVKATVAEPAAGGAPAVSVVSASPQKVVVLLFVNQVTESKKLSEPRVDLNRVRMTMVDTSDGWKVRTLDAL